MISIRFLLILLSITLLWLLLGATVLTLAFRHSFADALYLCSVTLSTVGWGDIVPTTGGEKAFVCVWVLFGLTGVFLVASTALSALMSAQEQLVLQALEQHTEAAVNASGDEKQLGGAVGDRGSTRSDKTKRRVDALIRVAIAVGVFALQTTIGAILFGVVEGKSAADSVYAAIISVLTIGYGDISFQSDAGRVLASIWVLVSTITVTWALSSIASLIIEQEQQRVAHSVVFRRLSAAEFRDADINDDGEVSNAEFVLLRLRQLGRISVVEQREMLSAYEKHVRKLRRRASGVDGGGDDGQHLLTSLDSSPIESRKVSPELLSFNPTSLRYRISDVLEGEGLLGRLFEWSMYALIAVAVLGFVFSTVPTWYERQTTLFEVFEWICTSFFTVEYALRAWTCTCLPRYARLGPILGRLRWLVSVASVVDFLAIAPTWLGLFLDVNVNFAVALRGLRLVRLLKIDRYNKAMATLYKVLRNNSALLITSAAFGLVTLLVSASALYYTERDGPLASEFDSVPSALWPTLLFLTGEFAYVDLTAGGKVIASFVAIVAVALFGVPTSVITAGFVTTMRELSKDGEEVECPSCGATFDYLQLD